MAKKRKQTFLEQLLHWIGTPQSLLFHTVAFTIIFALIPLFGVDRVMNVFTNILSLEAIYMAILIQMTVNRSHYKIRGMEEDIEDILDDTEELTK